MAKREPASSYGKIVNPKDRPIRKLDPVDNRERLSWALTRWRAASMQARNHPEDRALALAAEARREEYLDLKHLYNL